MKLFRAEVTGVSRREIPFIALKELSCTLYSTLWNTIHQNSMEREDTNILHHLFENLKGKDNLSYQSVYSAKDSLKMALCSWNM
jgi:hypothetical protein